jgi:glycosyltransferase involved in cell wall biosynthesis
VIRAEFSINRHWIDDMKDTALTIVTPSYNRADYLPRLYQSLLAQTRRDFEWIIVDDGSSDATQEVCAEFCAGQRLDIRVLRKENGGKHTAVNAGVAIARSALVFIVDSDDYLLSNAVERVLEVWSEFATERLSGMCFLRGVSATEVLGQRFDRSYEIASYIDMRFNRGVQGDKAEVYRADILKAHPFPEFAGEKFLAEDAVWARIGLQYDMVHVNEIIYVSNYLPGGLTRGDQSINVRSPRGSVESVKWFLSNRTHMKVRMPMAWRYIAYGRFARRSLYELVSKSGAPLFVATQIPLGVLLHLYWKRKFAAQLDKARAVQPSAAPAETSL